MKIGPTFLAPLLLSGWLLMLPPLDMPADSGMDKWTVNVDAPIHDWEQIGGYDSASACEDARHRNIEWHQAQGRNEPRSGVLILQAIRSRCVPATEIVPPGKWSRRPFHLSAVHGSSVP